MDKDTGGSASKAQTPMYRPRKSQKSVVQVVQLPQQLHGIAINWFLKSEDPIFFAKTEIPTEIADTTNANHKETRAPGDPIVA